MTNVYININTLITHFSTSSCKTKYRKRTTM